MASRKTARRRPRYRPGNKRRRHTVRRRPVKRTKNYRRQKPLKRTGTKLPRRLPSRKIRMTRDAWRMLHSYVDGIYKKVSGEAERLRRKDQRHAIISSDVKTALRQIMPRKYSRQVAYRKTH